MFGDNRLGFIGNDLEKMSYELSFWRYSDERLTRSMQDHTAVYHALCDGAHVDCLDDLPSEKIRATLFASVPAAWRWEAGAWTREGGGSIALSVEATSVVRCLIRKCPRAFRSEVSRQRRSFRRKATHFVAKNPHVTRWFRNYLLGIFGVRDYV